MEATSKDDQIKVWGDKEASNHEDEKREETSARRSTKMDPRQTRDNGTRQRIGTRRGFKEDRLWQFMRPKRKWVNLSSGIEEMHQASDAKQALLERQPK
ncbi:hypothetical protein A2U01_0053855, partial [Trifolium medium]|nr:hypothetical protein [Trifolium medium]